jgi:hypothetical protein
LPRANAPWSPLVSLLLFKLLFIANVLTVFNYNQFLIRKSSGGHQAKRIKEKKPKPEEQEGMPQRQHCPPIQHDRIQLS